MGVKLKSEKVSLVKEMSSSEETFISGTTINPQNQKTPEELIARCLRALLCKITNCLQSFAFAPFSKFIPLSVFASTREQRLFQNCSQCWLKRACGFMCILLWSAALKTPVRVQLIKDRQLIVLAQWSRF
jgi:hypothetical protein